METKRSLVVCLGASINKKLKKALPHQKLFNVYSDITDLTLLLAIMMCKCVYTQKCHLLINLIYT